jgi:hypothetical protein
MGGRSISPTVVRNRLPQDLLRHVVTFIPKRTPRPSLPGGLQKALTKLQFSPKRTAMDLYGLDDFVLN